MRRRSWLRPGLRVGRRAPTGVELGAAFAAALSLVAVAAARAQTSSGPPGSAASQIHSQADYAGAFDAATKGRFSQLIAAPDTATAIDSYDLLSAAYLEILDELYARSSPHANRLPAWYATKLLEIGLGALGDADGSGVGYFKRELSRGDFDRAVHAYYILSANDLALTEAGVPTALWRAMVNAARGDPRNRYWISLRLAEARLLSAGQFDRIRTKKVSRVESVREYVGKNANWLGARIHRVLGLSENLLEDPQVAHLRIRYAKEAARDRVRKHELLLKGPAGAYEGILAELREFGIADLDSKRFVQIMQKDLVYILDAYGPPKNPGGLLRELEALCRGKGQNRSSLWAHADRLSELYAANLSATGLTATGPTATGHRNVRPGPVLPTVDEILAQGTDAYAFTVRALQDFQNRPLVQHILDAGVIAALIERFPRDDVSDLRAAIRDAFHQLGYPQGLRAGYRDALAALGPAETTVGPSPATLEGLAAEVAAIRSLRDFDRAFASLRAIGAHSALEGTTSSGLATTFLESTLAVLGQEAEWRNASMSRSRRVRAERVAAAEKIATAETATVRANLQIRSANRDLSDAETRQTAAIRTRNEAVGRLNESVSQVDAARLAWRRATPGGEPAAAARRRLDEREAAHEALATELDELVHSMEKEAAAAQAAADAAEQRGRAALLEARRGQATARAAALQENSAFEREQSAETVLARSELRIASLLSRLVVGLDLLGLRADESDLGAPAAERAQRLLAAVLLMERAYRGQEIGAARPALLQAESSGDPQLEMLSRLALARAAEG